MTQLKITREATALVLATNEAVQSFLRNTDLSLPELEELGNAATRLNDTLHGAADVFIQAASVVRPEVLYEFAALYNLSPEALDTVIREGLERLAARMAESNALIAKTVQAKRAEGQTQQQIADDLGVDRNQVRDNLVMVEDTNTKSDCRVKADAEVVDEVKQRLAAGESGKSVAEATGLSPGRVSQIKNGKSGNESKTDVVPTTPTAGERKMSSDHHHSQPISLMMTEGSGPNLEMEENRKRYYENIKRCFKDIKSIEKRMKTLSRYFEKTYTKEHGGMVANWAAYERIWGPDMRDDELINCGSFDEVRQRLANQLHLLQGTVKTSLDVLQKINSLPIIIED